MKTIEIISHVYAEEFPAFASLMTAQVSSLFLWPPNCPVLYTVVGTPSDTVTFDALRRLQEKLTMQHSFALRWVPVDKPSLFRRGVMRNLAFKNALSDLVWAADADYLFGPGCLEALAGMDFKGLVFPQNAMIHKSHATGDAEIARIVPGEIFKPDLSLFEPWSCKVAIGGLQIVPRELANKGYLDGTKWSQPEPGATRFLDTKEDKKYRESVGGSTPISLPNLYRLRHSDSAFESKEKRLAQTAGK